MRCSVLLHNLMFFSLTISVRLKMSCKNQTIVPVAYIYMCVFLSSLQETYEAKRQEFLGELQRREEEMRQMFVQRVKEKEMELKEAERDVRTRKCRTHNCKPSHKHRSIHRNTQT